MAARSDSVRRAAARLGVAGAIVPVLLLAAPPAWAGGTTATPPRSTPVSSGPEQSLVVGTPTLTAAQRASAAAKDAAIARATAPAYARSGRVGALTEEPAPLPVHKSLKAITQQAQVRSYWCGPATLAMLVGADDASISQKTAAKRLHTTSSGTNWYSGNGTYPMETALEHYSDGFDYTAQNLAYSPTDDDVATFTTRLTADIAINHQGIAGNAVEVRNGPHLNGHPNRTIYHWVAVRGYDDSGATTRYADSVGGSSISWSAPVPRYNEIDTATIVTIFGARGYVW